MHPNMSSTRGRWATAWRLWAAALMLVTALAALAACGTATDNPSDCTADEYYDDATNLCTACPAAVVPDCQAGCGFEIVKDDRGCPVAQCVEQCQCGAGEFFSQDTLTCQKCADAANPPPVCAQ